MSLFNTKKGERRWYWTVYVNAIFLKPENKLNILRELQHIIIIANIYILIYSCIWACVIY